MLPRWGRSVCRQATKCASCRMAILPEGENQEKDKEDSEKQGQGPLINRVAALIPKQRWETPCTHVLWFTKWATAGLQPVRPAVVFKADLVLPAGKALSL